MVLEAGQTASPEADGALSYLCQAYWYPLYSFVRRKGYTIPEAEDLTQGFFAKFLEKRFLRSVAREKGKFRSFLLAALSHYMANEWDKSQTLKRGGGSIHLPLDTVHAEDRYAHDLAHRPSLDPGEAFDLSWAETLLSLVMERLRGEFERGGKQDRFGELKPFLLGDPAEGEYADVAHRLNMSQQGVKSAVYRLRQRFRDLVRREIGNTVATSSEIDDELRYFIRLMTA
ncbi:MAG: sigma-70 family RNA polymerase sigma factor [Verrucomicrobiae bacterium]|nr:sigma-70 family RNA polymerase sigma factor [Verrucomicrobiae bacterium]